ncbi:hypothetical protein [Desulfosarcina ovata]|uniref:Uncharacterized protein n=1 Tax=Desulfosarcina ovata subsp. ovata TaxID=2752305 RepID=A0A5K8AHK3_9BACT|nr:hypothetical protein [Desulfosarcina ovata]BBO91324.1 hypothetical protein DSCOOX_45040 [Desulfosarcina ovata subsp. ovata]
MPYYKCSNQACPTGGEAFSLTSAGQTFCPRCYTANALTSVATPVVGPLTKTRVIQSSNTMHSCPKKVEVEVQLLIDKWDLNSVSTLEAKKTKDYLFTLNTNAKRIDREGPVTIGSEKTVTHGKFRLQFGNRTYAGVRIQVDVILNAAVIRRAFKESLVAGKYVEVYLG